MLYKPFKRPFTPTLLLFVFGSVAMMAVTVPAREASAATINVTTTNMGTTNGDGCGLMEAVQALNNQSAYSDCAGGNGSNDTIVLRDDIGTYTIPYYLHIKRSVLIRSATEYKEVTIKNSSHWDSIYSPLTNYVINIKLHDLYFEGNASTTWPALTINGRSDAKVTLLRTTVGAFKQSGVRVIEADLEIIDSIIRGNESPDDGGGVYHAGGANTSLSISHSEISANTAQDSGGGVWLGAQGASSIVNSTIATNTASNGSGGGVYIDNLGNGYLNIVASTIGRNEADTFGGGVHNSWFNDAYVSESIIGRNIASSGPDWAGYLMTLDDSLLESNQSTNIPTGGQGPNNLIGMDPSFGNEWQPIYAGGRVRTGVLWLHPSSPAIDFISNSSQTEDQRHWPRTEGSGTDIGASEYRPNTETEFLTVTSKSSDTHSTYTHSSFSNGEATYLQANAVGDYVTYDFPMLLDGCADISVGVRKASNGGQVRMEYKAGSASWATIGPVLELYASPSDTDELSVVTNYKVITNSTQFRFTVVGKNSSSSGYLVRLDYIKVTKNEVGGCEF